jgi:hypothetical protein
MKKMGLILFVGFLGLVTWASVSPDLYKPQDKKSFEGIISFTKKTGTSESRYKYYIKGDMVRVEELNADGTLQGIMLVNTTDKSVKAISPERKMYMDVPTKSSYSTGSVSMEKKEATKSLMSYTCNEWVANSKDEDRVITYWMAWDNFDFFIPFLKTINRKDKQAVYFLAMTGTTGAFPMLSIETKSDGTEISRLTVTDLEKKELDKTLFEIPAGYSKM